MEALVQTLKNLWKDWQLRGLVLLSLIFQTILIIMGNRRKYSYQLLVRFAVWVAYLVADSVATMALGIISNDLVGSGTGKFDPNIELHVFWAPFLLLHLGGPDTITAYALEDNELWVRHLLGLALQSGVAFNTFLMAWRGSHLSILSTIMVFVGLSKYVERTWVLRSASSEQIKSSMIARRDLPGSTNPNLLKEYEVKKEEGYNVMPNRIIDIQIPIEAFTSEEDNTISQANELLKAYGLLRIFKRIFVNLLLTSRDRDTSLAVFQNLSFEKAFEVVEMELAFMYDLLYTKASVVYSRWGLSLRCINLSLTCIVLVLFSLADEKHKYKKPDLFITFLLLVVAILLDIYAALVILFSDWTIVWLSLHKKTSILSTITSIQLFQSPRWSNSMAQYDFLGFALREKPLINDPILSEVKPHFCHKILKLFKFLGMVEKQEKERYVTKEAVPTSLKELIFKHLQERRKATVHHGTSDAGKQKFTVETFGHEELIWSMEKGFNETILIWHIATDICYYLDKETEESIEAIKSKREMSILMSRYLMHLLVYYPSMLPAGLGDILIEDTCAEVIDFCNTPEPPRNKLDAYDKMVKAVIGAEVLGKRYKARLSMLSNGYKLARCLIEIPDREKKWRLIAETWAEMLAHAASHCEGSQHRQQLRRAGQLVTHVWLLMAHLGLTDHFQILQPRDITRLTPK